MNKPKLSVTRQLKDIISQAERLKHSQNFESEAIDFSKYNQELKTYILTHYEDPMIVESTQNIPHINYKSVQHKYWYWLVLPMELVYLWQRYRAKDIYLQEVSNAKSIYSSLLFLLRNE